MKNNKIILLDEVKDDKLKENRKLLNFSVNMQILKN